MSQLIKLNVSKRTPSPGNEAVINPAALFGFDVEDIIVPIRRNAGNTVSYFTSRMMKGSTAGASDNNGRADYEVTEALAAINGQSSFLSQLTVLFRTERNVDMNSESMVFVRSRISENLKPWIDPLTGIEGGTEFYYNEDGDPLPVKYIVEESVNTIVSAGGGGGGGMPITEIDYNLAGGTEMDLGLYSGELIINVTNNGAPSGTLNTIINITNISKITIRPAGALELTVNDGNGATNPKLYAPTLVIFGAGKGFLELNKRLGKFYETNYIDQYN